MKRKIKWLYLGCIAIITIYVVHIYKPKDRQIIEVDNAHIVKIYSISIDMGFAMLHIYDNYLQKTYKRENLRIFFSTAQNYETVTQLLGLPCMIEDQTKNKAGNYSNMTGFVVYFYEDDLISETDIAKYGTAIIITLENGVVDSWGIYGNNITIPPYKQKEIDLLLKSGMSPKDIENIFGQPTTIEYDSNGEISSYGYTFNTPLKKNSSKLELFGGLGESLVICFEDNIFTQSYISEQIIIDWKLYKQKNLAKLSNNLFDK